VPGFHQYFAFVRYWLNAVDEHSLHSPFLFDLMTKVINVRPDPDETIEALRRKMTMEARSVSVVDLGTGYSAVPRQRKIGDIARRTLSPIKYSGIYQRLIRYFKCEVIVELGTSLGINTMYMARPTHAKVYTFEGAPAITKVARENFSTLGAQNITLIEGDISNTLPPFLRQCPRIDLVFVDANHKTKPCLRYFDWILEAIHPESIVILDDIHLTQEMENAWAAIKNHESVQATVDLFRCGMVFFRPSLNKQHVVLQV
jgi:predicted O-methyltransferase YrrM